tara:strand:- start:158 stop:463 length:306 start_codon:yes stop_codon:yes gene_type:complete
MNDEWKNYFSDREICITSVGIKLIKPKNFQVEIPIECLVCGFFMRGLEDVLSHEKYKCCQECTYNWAESNYHKWKDGWRPSKNEIQEYRNSIMNQPTFRVR